MTPVFGFGAVTMTTHSAHGGVGEVHAARVLHSETGPLAFLDLVVVPPGTTIGRHTHGDDEEIYVLVHGYADVVVDGVRRRVGPGDVVVNRPGGTHELANPGPAEVRLVVVDVRHASSDHG